MRSYSILALGIVALIMVACGDDEPDDNGGGSDPKCGNGTIETGEQCDDGAANSDVVPGACRTSCRRAWCGDGVVDTGEDCDGVDLGGETCTSQGFSKGSLSCSSACKLDTSACSGCGNGILEGSEECDGDETGEATCATVASKQHGYLDCKSDCTLDSTYCHTCGDGTVEAAAGEVCEPPDKMGGLTCKTYDAQAKYAYGELGCGADTCQPDDDACRSFCGNGVIEGEEQCDREQVPSTVTCADLTAGAFPNGEVTCAPSCMLSSLHCHACGNNHKDLFEECDGSDLGGTTCETLWGGGSTGTLGCTQDCHFDSTLCVPATTCGDGIVDDGEQCDGTNLGGKTCADLAVYGGGHLACLPNCLFDTSACEPVPCGNEEVDGDYGEQCDGTNLGGVSCTSLGFGGGALACTSWCTYDVTGCEPASTCGDGVVDDGEDCDGMVPPGATCQDLEFLPGGNVQCATNCKLDVSNCVRCGDGKLSWDEACDGTQLRGLTCGDFGKFGGTLGCTLDCKFDVTACNDCGNGVLDTGEECEVGQVGVSCADIEPALPDGEPACDPNTCTVDGSTCHKCGNGQIEGPEDCDPQPQTTCADEGYSNGLAVCNANCIGADLSGCWRAGDGECNIGAGENLSSSEADCGWKKISAGLRNTCAVKNDGSVFCWGFGLASGAPYGPLPVSVALPDKALELSVGNHHACAVLESGAVYCWGNSDNGELGNGLNESSATPVEVSTVMGAVGVTAGSNRTCAWQGTGATWCWGSDAEEGLGTGPGDGTSHVPVLVSGAGAVAQVSLDRGSNGESTAMALRTDGSVVGWGDNAYYAIPSALGLGPGSVSVLESPLIISPLGSDNAAVAVGQHFTCVLEADATVVCSGSGNMGQLGNGGTGTAETHGPVDFLTGVLQVVAGGAGACARTQDGEVFCWGQGTSGQIGNGTNENAHLAPSSTSAAELPSSSTNPATYVTIGGQGAGSHVCALLADGTAWCWGSGTRGELGNGAASSQNVPVKVVEPTH